jgi:hypothetical protein
MRLDSSEGRRRIHQEIRDSGAKTQDRIMQLTNAVGELKGEIKGMK